MKHWKTILRLFAMLLMVVVLGTSCTAAMASESKTLTVGAGETYTTIQEAINYVDAQTDSAGWTINVKAGEYERFTVPNGIVNLSIVGESESDVVIDVLNGEYTGSILVDHGGINIYGKNITLKNLTIKAGTSKRNWDDSAISTHHGMIGGKNISLTVDNCTLIGPGIGNGALYGIFWACSEMNVTNCNISGFANAIEYMNDGFNVPAGETFEITGNTITGASFAIHGYMGGGNGGGTLLIANNTITGTDDLRSKVIVQDNTTNSLVTDIRNNTLTNAMVGTVNLQDEGDLVSDVLQSNEFGDNCFFVEAIEPGTIEFYTAYQAPDGQYGEWTLSEIDFGTYSGWYQSNLKADYRTLYRDQYNTDAEFNDAFKAYWQQTDVQKALNTSYNSLVTYVKSSIASANEDSSNELNISAIDQSLASGSQYLDDKAMAERTKNWDVLVPTFTWFKDAIYWVTGEAPTPTPAPIATPAPAAMPPQTGDGMPLLGAAVCMILAAAAFLTLSSLRKRV